MPAQKWQGFSPETGWAEGCDGFAAGSANTGATRQNGGMGFTPGDEVHVAAFGKGTIREVRNGGRYLVEVKGRSMVVGGSQLTAVEERKGRRRSTDATANAAVPESLARTHAAVSLDLHGMTVEEAIAALDVFLNDAILAGFSEVRAIHGRSGGRLKAAVHGRLKQVLSVRAFRVDPRNEGVTIVTL